MSEKNPSSLLTDFFDGYIEEQFEETKLISSQDDMMMFMNKLEDEVMMTPCSSRSRFQDDQYSPSCKKKKKVSPISSSTRTTLVEDNKVVMMSQQHITVERNRRKQMNQHLSVLRSLMPCFYVKRADQASIIGGVVDYISQLQQVLQSLEAKKQRKA